MKAGDVRNSKMGRTTFKRDAILWIVIQWMLSAGVERGKGRKEWTTTEGKKRKGWNRGRKKNEASRSNNTSMQVLCHTWFSLCISVWYFHAGLGQSCGALWGALAQGNVTAVACATHCDTGANICVCVTGGSTGWVPQLLPVLDSHEDSATLFGFFKCHLHKHLIVEPAARCWRG